VPELRSLGSVRGALSNARPYREQVLLTLQVPESACAGRHIHEMLCLSSDSICSSAASI
jgi:hypothetical protein